MNSFYCYPHIEYWNSGFWNGHLGEADALLQWIQGHNPPAGGGFSPPECGDPTELPTYRSKTKCVDLPEIVEHWERKGLRYTSLEQGCKLWISMIPLARKKNQRIPVLVVPVQQSCSDPWWAMKTLAAQRKVLEMAARRKNLAVLFLVTEKQDTDRIYSGIFQEALVLYKCDPDQVLLDVRVPREQGMPMGEIEGFHWVDAQGRPADPEESVELLDGWLPVLNVSGRWGSRDSISRGLVMVYAMNNGTFDRERFIHSLTGRQTMDGVMLEHRYDSATSPDIMTYWRSVGLEAGTHETDGERWMTLCPRETPRRVPLMIIMQEVNRGNEHLAVTAMGTYHAMTQIAAQGECMLLFFALEHPDDNDLLEKIIREAAEQYPVDLTQVYIMGHSHNGYFALHFAIRHPNRITAVATLGTPMALEPPEERGEPILSYTDEQIEKLSRVDMPLINICGYCERSGRVPQESTVFTRWIKNIQRRMKASRCPVPTEQEIRLVKGCSDVPRRKLGIPASHSETVWHDGVEHYILDIYNLEGKSHLRLVSSENMPHMVTPYMQEMAWSFLRRFARDAQTLEITERY